MRNLGPYELLAIVIIIMVLFGGKKIPELLHGMGKGWGEFKRGAHGLDDLPKTPEAKA